MSNLEEMRAIKSASREMRQETPIETFSLKDKCRLISLDLWCKPHEDFCSQD